MLLDIAVSTALHCTECLTYCDVLRCFVTVLTAAVATHAEDVLYQITTEFICKKTAGAESESERAESNWKMQTQHFITAALCIGSYVTGYARIGSLVMFLHDFSDIFVDILRLTTIMQVSDTVMIGAYVLTMVAWFWWRLVYYPLYILGTIVGEFQVACSVLSLFYKLCVALRAFSRPCLSDGWFLPILDLWCSYPGRCADPCAILHFAMCAAGATRDVVL